MEDNERSEQKMQMLNAESLLMGFIKATLIKSDEPYLVDRSLDGIELFIEENAKDDETKEALLDALHCIYSSFSHLVDL